MKWRKLKQQNTKKKIAPQQQVVYARYVDKIKALITDMFMIYAPILYLITYVILNGKEAFQASALAQFSGVALYGIIYAIFLARSGQTPGKKAYTIQVVDAKSLKKISFFRALWRFVAFLFTATTLVGLLFPFYNKERRALHDFLSKTVEIEVQA